jgi:tetratricopeptide (TPR) repeat protein
MAISLADSTGNTRRHSQVLDNFARLKWSVGDYSASQLYAHESRRLARISAEPYREAVALSHEALCVYTLGDYKQSISLCNRARSLLGLCGASGGQMEYQIMIHQAEVHKLKSEYVEARNIHSELLREVSKTQDFYHHTFTLLNIAEINVAIGTPTQIVQRDIQTARKIFNTRELHMEVMMCETTLADLYLRDGNIQAAEKLLNKAIRSTTPHPQIIPYCLERLGDVTRWNVSPCPLSWTTVYFVYALKFKERLAIHKALQFLGDIFLSYNNDETSSSLYTVALEGFTQMDVHRSRAECMLHLGDISKGRGDLLKALELWEKARPLFERSSQAKQVDNIDGRLASVGEDVLELHRKNLAHLAEINAPSGDVEELEDNLSDIEDPEVDLYTL